MPLIEYQYFNFIGKIRKGKSLIVTVQDKWSNQANLTEVIMPQHNINIE